jgi:hypothetical protein
MLSALASSRSVVLIGLGVAACLCVACSRPSAAPFLPMLELGVSVRRRAGHDRGLQPDATQHWDTVALVSLRFRPFNPAAALPERGELLPETWIAPCDPEDTICLQEATEAEREIGVALGELQ